MQTERYKSMVLNAKQSEENSMTSVFEDMLGVLEDDPVKRHNLMLRLDLVSRINARIKNMD